MYVYICSPEVRPPAQKRNNGSVPIQELVEPFGTVTATANCCLGQGRSDDARKTYQLSRCIELLPARADAYEHVKLYKIHRIHYSIMDLQ